jgi:SpoVK/Ycf46/Vps4 family AAA+-type ATPase
MAAQVIAHELGQEIYRIDMASMVSKYIGETAKNLGRILDKADGVNAVLFFDEADSLFARRTEIKDSHDRYANADTNYLLQRLEQFDGIFLLATNRMSAIDSGFLRRIRYLIEFSKPDRNHRERIWRKCLHGLSEGLALDSVLPFIANLAAGVEITGAQIKSAVITSLFICMQNDAEFSLDHILLGLNQEMLKEGRMLSERDVERIKRIDDR